MQINTTIIKTVLRQRFLNCGPWTLGGPPVYPRASRNSFLNSEIDNINHNVILLNIGNRRTLSKLLEPSTSLRQDYTKISQIVVRPLTFFLTKSTVFDILLMFVLKINIEIGYK